MYNSSTFLHAVIIAGFRFELKNTSLARDNDFKKDNLDFFLAKQKASLNLDIAACL